MTTSSSTSFRGGGKTAAAAATTQQDIVLPAKTTNGRRTPSSPVAGGTGSNSSYRNRFWLVGLLAMSFPFISVVDWLLADEASGRGLAFTEEFLLSTRPIQFGGQYGTDELDSGTKNEYPQRHNAHERAALSNKNLKGFGGAKATTTTISPESVCLTTACLQGMGQALARVFPDRTNRDQWCKQQAANEPNKEGLLLVKVPKAASSTSAGVALRIANLHKCQALQWQHKPGKTYANRNKEESFMFTSIRDPASRVLSYLFFMDISIDGVEYSEEWVLDRLKHFSGRYGSIEEGQGGFTMQFAALESIPHFSAWSPENRTSVVDLKAIQARVQRMVDGYDFMLVVERMDESLVALALILGIDVGDVLVTSSKVAGSYFYDPPRRQCVSLTKSFASPAVQTYLESDDWRAQNYGDYLLHAAANRSLDLTIERIGKKKFRTAMDQYQLLKKLEKDRCAPKVEFPCSKTGKPQPRLARRECYQRDFGCGHKCIDEMIKNQAEEERLVRLMGTF